MNLLKDCQAKETYTFKLRQAQLKGLVPVIRSDGDLEMIIRCA
jgi:hypothetical protein